MDTRETLEQKRVEAALRTVFNRALAEGETPKISELAEAALSPATATALDVTALNDYIDEWLRDREGHDVNLHDLGRDLAEFATRALHAIPGTDVDEIAQVLADTHKASSWGKYVNLYNFNVQDKAIPTAIAMTLARAIATRHAAPSAAVDSKPSRDTLIDALVDAVAEIGPGWEIDEWASEITAQLLENEALWKPTRYAAPSAAVVALLEDFVDEDDCSYDHHGYCQAHSWLATDPQCPHKRAKEYIAAQATEPRDGEMEA